MNNPVRMEDPVEPTTGQESATTHPRLDIDTDEPAPGVVVLRLRGDLDMLTASGLHDAAAKRLQPPTATLVLDLTKIGFLGSAGLSELVTAHEAASANGVNLLLAANSRVVLRPLEITGLSPMFRTFESTEAALGEV